MTEKKNIKEAACNYEISHNLEESLDALFALGFLPHVTNPNEMTESDAYCWIEDKPSDKDMDKFLKEMGY
ncbi:hypothetical protein J6O86_02960 [bacterium]|nr:hypothetical protein [bacterium]